MRPTLLLALVPLFAFVGCATGPEGSRGPGIVLTDAGFRANTDQNERADITGHITADLDAALMPRWTSAVTISELPKWLDSGASDDGRWSWPTITAQVVLTGHGDLPLSVAAVHDGVVEYLNKKVDRHGTVTVTVTTRERGTAAEAASTTATAVAPTPAPATPPEITHPIIATPAPIPPMPQATPAAPAQRTYTVQAGDTLADIATLFYGSPAPWREIVAANPGLDPAKLTPGQTLVIPPKP